MSFVSSGDVPAFRGWRVASVTAGVALFVAAVSMPTGWYDGLPRPYAVPLLPLRGVTLLRILLGVHGAAMIVVGLRRFRFDPLPDGAPGGGPISVADDLSPAQARRWLAAITALALLLRVTGIGADLWIDELLTLQQVADRSLLQVIGAYPTANNHLLTSLSVKGAIWLFGEHEWSIRLSTMLLGTLSVPALYRTARLASSRRASLLAALLLAVSYHHIFFSQNARGYVPYVCFSLISVRALADAVRRDRAGDWVLYGVSMLLGVLSLLLMVFVIAAQLLVMLGVMWSSRRRGVAIGPLVRRLALVLTVTGFLCVEVYAIALPEAWVYLTSAYTQPASGSQLGSGTLRDDVLRGVANGFAFRTLLTGIPFLALAASGMLVLWRRSARLAATLLLPGMLMAALFAVRGMNLSPRYFLLWLPLAIVAAVVTIDEVALRRWGARATRRHLVPVAVGGLLACLCLASLARYYTVPKQSFRDAVRYLERIRRPDDLVVLIRPAHLGVHYYAARRGSALDAQLVDLTSAEGFDRLLSSRGTRRVIAVTTMERHYRSVRPDLLDLINAGWQRDTTFAATVADGDITIWTERTPPTAAPATGHVAGDAPLTAPSSVR